MRRLDAVRPDADDGSAGRIGDCRRDCCPLPVVIPRTVAEGDEVSTFMSLTFSNHTLTSDANRSSRFAA